MARKLCFALVFTAAVLPAMAGERNPSPEATVVDSGSFGIFVAGKRVATETFQIQQLGDGSLTKSELKAQESTAVQNSELQLSAAGELRRYTWNEISPGKAQTVVEPQDQLLIEHLIGSGSEKPIDQPYILPASTAILDDYFFVHRELLAWRYLGSGCHPVPGQSGCKLPRVQFGALIPRQRTSLLVNMEYVGPETVTIRGEQRQLSRFNLQGEGMDWALWLDSNYKLVRVVIASKATEVLRD